MSLSSVSWIGASWGSVDLNSMESNTEEQENKLWVETHTVCKYLIRLT